MTEIKRPLKVFLYHAPVDKAAVRDLYLRLIQAGVDTWLVKEKILPGQDWREELHHAIAEADVVLVCVSKRSNQLDSRQKELWTTFDSVIEQLDGEIPVIPVLLEECDRLENLRKWQWVDLFEETGYEVLMRALQARADELGAVIQAKESSLPHVPASHLKPGQLLAAKNPGEVRQPNRETLNESGVLVDGPVVKLQRPAAERKLRRAVLVALIALLGSMVAFMLRSPQFQRWYQLAQVALEVTSTPLPAPRTQVNSIEFPQPEPISTLAGQEKVAHVVFLIDTSGSMQGQRIRNVKSAVSRFVSLLGDDYLVSVIEFDIHVELRVSSTHNHLEASQAIKSISIDVPHNGSCIRDVIYAAVQQASLIPVEEEAASMIIVLTDVALGENVGWNCSIRYREALANLVRDHPAPIFSIYVGDDFDETSSDTWLVGTERAALAAKNEKEIDRILLSISKAAGLEMKAEINIPVPVRETRHASMVFVPPGQFILGSNMVYLDSFWIDKTEVTNAMYAGCVQAGKCSPPRENRSHTRERYYGNSEFDDYPVIYASWVDAENYCRWAGGRLPTEAEWEKAARGTDGRPFPWGEEDPSGLSGLLNFRAQDTVEVASYPDGASPYGALDMAGNVSEWVADWLSLEYYNTPPAANPLGPDSGEYRVWRGGSWANTSTERVRTYSRTGNFPTDSSGGIGFRCAWDAGP